MRLLLAVSFVALAFAGCVGEDAPSATGERDGSTSGGGAPPVAGPASARIRDNAFEPTLTSVPVGTTITWRNAGERVHSVVSPDGAFPGSGPLEPGATFTYTFQQPGEYAIRCRYHADMAAKLVVA